MLLLIIGVLIISIASLILLIASCILLSYLEKWIDDIEKKQKDDEVVLLEEDDFSDRLKNSVITHPFQYTWAVIFLSLLGIIWILLL
ncbi:hypothetical protein C7391_0421 [Methanimicrococcus blatticola]|uniref:Uncharacterized protein n=2 Tax=Methanimicrococcus blatticola TaxID=91560 RepID=A0A484F4K6_9EURY|nr:hypothetical protein [Methanimicrococcus blatticola]MCC2508463.1 hypothetical protein [Methanimicrococcus blatticola]TDQ70086.1 hypothetical protein C7391_0421 [Methanimicrococcus blatticola]